MRAGQGGFCLVELLVVLALVGLLGGLAGGSGPPAGPALAAVQGELRAAVEQAFLLARARGCRVRVALGGAPAGRSRRGDRVEVPPLVLPRGVRWGLPPSAVPLPPGMRETRQAHLTGPAHPGISVTPRAPPRPAPGSSPTAGTPCACACRTTAASPSCAGAGRRGPLDPRSDMRMADLSPEQRPRERLLAGRGEELSDADLLALLWGTGRAACSAVEAAQDLLTRCGGLAGILAQGLADWLALPGLGPARACQLWAAPGALPAEPAGRPGPPRIPPPAPAGAYLLSRCQGWTEERFGLLALNARGERSWPSGSSARAPAPPPWSAPGSSSGRPCATAPSPPWPSTTTPPATPPPAGRTSSSPGACVWVLKIVENF